MLESVIYLLLLFGIFLAGLVNHIRWRRRAARIREHWTAENDRQRREYEKLLDQQSWDFSRRVRILTEKNLQLREQLRSMEAAYEDLSKR